MNNTSVLILPGWKNSGPQHWQSLWEAAHGYARAEQHDWQRPLRGDWIARLEDVLLSRPEPSVLVAHSLGCLLVAAWAAHSRNPHLVKAALLVAPADAARDELAPVLASWSPVVLRPLPFPSVLVGSRNDPYCSFERAQAFANHWGSAFKDLGEAGHINTESGLGAWPQGHDWLLELLETPTAPQSDPNITEKKPW